MYQKDYAEFLNLASMLNVVILSAVALSSLPEMFVNLLQVFIRLARSKKTLKLVYTMAKITLS